MRCVCSFRMIESVEVTEKVKLFTKPNCAICDDCDSAYAAKKFWLHLQKTMGSLKWSKRCGAKRRGPAVVK